MDACSGNGNWLVPPGAARAVYPPVHGEPGICAADQRCPCDEHQCAGNSKVQSRSGRLCQSERPSRGDGRTARRVCPIAPRRRRRAFDLSSGDHARSSHGDDSESRAAARERHCAAARRTSGGPPAACRHGSPPRLFACRTGAGQVPFAQQQKTLAANPGRPITPAALSGLQKSQKAAPPAVIIVNPATLTRLKNPPVVKSTPQKVAPVRAPVVLQKPTAPAAPAMQPRVVTAAPRVRQPVVKPSAGAPQKVIAPEPRAQQPVAAKPAQAVQQNPPGPREGQQPASSGGRGQKPPLKPLPDDQRLLIKPSGD